MLRRKYNDMLEETLVSRKHGYVMNVCDALKSSLFDRADNLTNDGKMKLWHEIDQQIKLYDRQELDLTPRLVVSESRSIERQKLPTPPPIKEKSARC